MRNSFNRLCIALFLCAASRPTSRAEAQTTINMKGWSYRTTDDERWIYPGQRAERVPRVPLDAAVPVALDSVKHSVDGATSFFNGARDYNATTTSVAWRNALGTIDSIRSHGTVLSYDRGARTSSVADTINDEAFIGAKGAAFFDEFLMFLGLPKSTAASRIDFGLRAKRVMRDVTGTMTSRVLRDSSAAGRQFKIIRDSARVVFTTENSFWERTLYGVRSESRRMSGTIVTRRVFDVELEVTVRVADTISLHGNETQRFPDGRSFSSPVQYQRHRTVALLDSAGQRAFSDAARRGSMYDGVGMVIRAPVGTPRPPDCRMAATRDSIVNAFKSASRQAQRDSIERGICITSRTGLRESIAHAYIEQGDTANAIRITNLEYDQPLTVWLYRLVRPVLDNPALAMHYGVKTNELYEAFEYQYKNYPPLIVEGTPRQWCEPGACELVAEEWKKAKEPRLRYIGLMALYSLDPARWADTLIRVANSAVQQLKSVSDVAQGMTHSMAGYPQIPLPSAGADWHSWLSWLRGENDSTLAYHDSIAALKPVPPSLQNRQLLRIRPSESPASAIRLAEMRFNVSYVDTLAANFARTDNDTARYVFGLLLDAFNRRAAREPDAILKSLLSQSIFERTTALREMSRLRFGNADSATSTDIEGTILNALLDSASLWTPFDSTVRQFGALWRVHPPNKSYLLSDSSSSFWRVPQARLERASVTLKPNNWRLPDEESGLIIKVGRVQRAGAFARVSIEQTGLVRLADGRGGGEAQWGSYTLVLIDGRWRILDQSWIVT